MKIELTSSKKPKLTPAEIAALEAEKAQILASLARPRPTQPEPAPEVEPAAPEASTPAPPPEPEPTVAIDVQAAGDERRRIEREIEALKVALVTAQRKEKIAQHQAVLALQAKAQAEGRQALAPWKPRLERHLAEITRLQHAYGPTLKDYARSMPSDPDAQVRRKIGEVYRAAAPLGQKLGDARATIEAASRGLTVAMQSSQSHVHMQARALAEAALEVNLLTLEAECRGLIQQREELRPGHVVQSTTPDHMPPIPPPAPLHTHADFGKVL